MEKHIFKFGSSSLGLIVPKKWVEKRKLKANSPVFVRENSSGDLVVSPLEWKERTLEKVASKKTDPDALVRWITVCYMYGIGKLRIFSQEGFRDEQLSAVQKELKDECPGFEIITQSSNEIRIEDLTDLKEIDLGKILKRLSSLVQQEFLEIQQGSHGTVDRLEELVDRFYMLGIRYVNIVQPGDMIRYYKAIQMMEMISDNLATLSSKGMGVKQTSIIKTLSDQFNLVFKGFESDEKAIAAVSELRKEIREKVEGMRVDAVQKKLIKEVATYSSQIAEFGLLQEKEEPLQL
jgi:phosphate uptake regulator